MYFKNDDGSQNDQPILDTLELKKKTVLIMLIVENQRGYILLNLRHYILLSCIAQNLLDMK